MAIQSVSGSTFGITAADPGINIGDTKAVRQAAYEALTYTQAGSCFLTTLPIVQTGWDRSQDPVTVCDDDGQILSSFKTNRTAADATVAGMLDNADALIQLLFELHEDRVQVATYEMVFPNGTDKIFGQVQVDTFTADPTNVEGRWLFSCGMFYEELPLHTALGTV